MAPFALTGQVPIGSPEPVEILRGLSELLRPGMIQPKFNAGDTMKLSRKQITEALQTVPIEHVLFGAVESKETKLTPKQREFARQLALGESKAGAYRKSRTSKAKPETQSKRGQELAKLGAVQAQADAFRAAYEAAKYTTPAHLRSLAIHQLTMHALNEECPPAQRIKALELIGKMTEVALFTERREVVQVTDAAQIKARLMDTLRQAVQAQAIDVDTDAESLLAELDPGAAVTDGSEAGHEHGPGAAGDAYMLAADDGGGNFQAAAPEAAPTPPRTDESLVPPPA